MTEKTHLPQGIGGAEPLPAQPRICVCVCTFRRPKLLQGVLNQVTEGKFTISIVVIDNDETGSGRQPVAQLQHAYPGRIAYFVEPVQSIAGARNRTVSEARGDFLAFIDDDEVPEERWLLRLYDALLEYKADGVLGPVEPRFALAPPEWLMKSGVFDRPNSRGRRTGAALDWRETGTGNALIRKCVAEELEGPFRLQFGSGGEDLDFFRRATDRGRSFVWCDEALAYETVPIERTRLGFQLRRALLRGRGALSHPSGRWIGVIKSLVASGLYSVLLPIFLLGGRHLFVRFLIKDCDHAGKLLGLCGIKIIRQKYVVR